MVELVNSIIPVFIIIFLGYFLRRREMMDDSFIIPANRLVFYIGVPALVFRELARADFNLNFNAPSIILSLTSVCIVYGAAWLLTTKIRIEKGTRGTFLQGSIHGNISYIGLAMIMYTFGEVGIQRAGILAGFLILLNNCFASFSLQKYSSHSADSLYPSALVKSILNPVVAGSFLGLLASLWSVPIPLFLDRSLKIIGQMALPTALLIMGAGLSFREMVEDLPLTAGLSFIKLVALPGTGWFLFHLFNVPAPFALPSLILLATPSAALTYIMATEMGGDTRFATSAIGLSTLSSAVTFFFWFKSF